MTLDLDLDLSKYQYYFVKTNLPISECDDNYLLFFKGLLRFEKKNNRLMWLYPLKKRNIEIRLCLIGLAEWYSIHGKNTFKLNDFVEFLTHKQNYSRYLVYIYLMKELRQVKKDNYYYSNNFNCSMAELELEEINSEFTNLIPDFDMERFKKSFLIKFRLSKLKVINSMNILARTSFIDIYQVQSRTSKNISDLFEFDTKMETYDQVRLNRAFMIFKEKFVYEKILF